MSENGQSGIAVCDTPVMSSLSTGNGLLDRIVKWLPDLERWVRRQEEPPRAVLYGPGDPMPHLYFPAGGVLSVIVRAEEGESVEVATVGSEGMVPIAALLRVRRSHQLVVQQIPGVILRVPAAPLVRAVREHDRVQTLALCYAAYSLRVSLQATACNALHGIHKRIARWLLMTADRAGSDRFFLTQDLLAEMLGMPRQTVNVAMRALARVGLLSVHRGRVELLDRRGLEHAACECYALMSHHYRELLG
jgi:CRP-like cAMP-binding protein